MKTFKEFVTEGSNDKEELSPLQKAVEHGNKNNHRWAYHHIKKHKLGFNPTMDDHAKKLAYNLHLKMNKDK